MSFTVKGFYSKDVEVSVSNAELLKAIERAWHRKHTYSLEIYIKDGWLMSYECTSGHNNDWGYTKFRLATPEEIEQYAFWLKLKDLFKE